MSTTRVLIVDDVHALAEQYAYDVERLGGYETLVATGGDDALDVLAREPVDCVLLDLEMPGTDGFDVLRSMRERDLDVPVIVYTGTGTYDRCVQAVQLGAFGFIDKADPMERVAREIEKALEHQALVSQVRALRRELGESSLVGTSPPMERLREAIARLAPIPSPVLVLGESGSGKELVARDLHRLGPNAGEPFVAINCAALPENLVESELFGHERGAFTGAHRTRRGAFETARGGTLFLDEIAELPPPAQAKLLRVLEDRQVTRVGGERALAVLARVVAATNRDLEAWVEAGRFRQDLHFRLNVHSIVVPPLRDRLSDVPALVEHFLADTCARFGVRPKRIDAEALAFLMAYGWEKNNVRELRNAVERMVLAADGPAIEAEHVPGELRADGAGALPVVDVTSRPKTFQELKAEAERRILLLSLERNDWQITRTAKELGLADHSSLLKIMRRHNIASRR